MHPFDDADPTPLLPLALPQAPPEPERPAFPVLATLAPVGGALALWAITGSPFSLVFAVLGPIVALTSLLDARRQARRRLRRAAADREARLDDLRAEISARHDEERRAAWRLTPSPSSIVSSAARPVWTDPTPKPLVLGAGVRRSSVRIDGVPTDARDRAVLERAVRLSGAPVLAEPSTGIGFVGPLALARSAARAALVQLVGRVDPRAVAVAAPSGAEWEWVRRLPHGRLGASGPARGDAPCVVVIDPASEREVAAVDAATGAGVGPQAARAGAAAGGSPRPLRSGPAGRFRLVVAEEMRLLPPGLATVLRLSGPRAAVVHRDGAAPAAIEPALVGSVEAQRWGDAMAGAAALLDLTGDAGIPRRVALAELPAAVGGAHARTSLAVAVGVADDGPLLLDLVEHGPHALVAGTTGSGKSEFLLAWLAALARAYPPALVSFLLVDFKGGAAFEPIRGLPHVVGVVTDLDESEALRAVESLRAELRHREAVLAGVGARDLRELGEEVPLGRLVIVVDEFQAMIERFPELGGVIADIAARGRSLGVHLVLASQRPNGVVREQVTANCAIRVSLRVMQRVDSLAVVGTEEAAEIPPGAPGRAVVDRGDGRPVRFQSAIADEAAVLGARVASASLPRARRPWVDPLPRRIAPDELDALLEAWEPASGGVSRAGAAIGPRSRRAGPSGFGLVDEPERQRRSAAAWDAASDGHLLVAGMPGSGRSTALEAIAAVVRAAHGESAVVRLEGPRSAIWDAIERLVDDAREIARGPRLLVIDDLDTRLRSWPDDYRALALERLETLLREGRSRGLAVAASTSQWLGVPHGLRDAFGIRLLLRHATRAELTQAGGAGELWRSVEVPGAGQWRGRRVQVVDTPVPGRAGSPWPSSGAPLAAHVPALDIDRAARIAVVTTSPSADAELLRSAGHAPVVLGPHADASALAALGRPGAPVVAVGSAEAWSAQWSLLSTIRETATILVRGGASEYRALIADRVLPPLLDEGATQVWVRPPGGATVRRRWPLEATTDSAA
ncbi:FtsK/SpoIIIE domain-containing protein [Agromyces italicus]|uniref:FtsK/SpoIIIE domain-containing protein n=1 Tax=Agromyces italicus TaxID=279572 RepID=UPI0003B45D5C|nr:FtsK/SpoIIIE domain-containing protein [Agromyces italicus]